MAAGIFRVGVQVYLIDRITAGLAGITRAISNAGTVTRNLNATLAGVQARIAVGAGILGVGVVGLTWWERTVRMSAQLQQNMFGLQMTTRASNREMQDFLRTAVNVSNVTMFSLNTLTDMAKQMAQMGLGLGGKTAEPMLTRIADLLPLFARAAEVLQLVKGVPISQTVALMGGLSHMFGQYTPGEVSAIGDYFTRGALLTPGSPRQLLTMGGYMIPMLSRVMGVKAEDLVPLMLASQMTGGPGMAGARGPFSGAMWSNLFQRAMPGVFGSGLWKGKGAEALRALGFTQAGVSAFINPTTGKFDAMGFMTALGQRMAQTETMGGQRAIAQALLRQGVMTGDKNVQLQAHQWLTAIGQGRNQQAAIVPTLFQWAFGAAGRTGAIAGTQGFQQLVNQAREYILHNMTTQQMQNFLLLTANDQWNQLITNLESFRTLLGVGVLPNLTEFIRQLANIAQRGVLWELGHPETTRRIFAGMGVGFGGLAITGGWTVLTALMRALGMISRTAGMAETLAALATFGAEWGAVSGVLYLVATHWTELAKIIARYPNVKSVLSDPLSTLATAMRGLGEVVSKAAGPMAALKSSLGWFFDRLDKAIGELRGTTPPLAHSPGYEAWKKTWGPGTWFGAPPPELAPGWRPPPAALPPPSKHPASLHVHIHTDGLSEDPARVTRVAELIMGEVAKRLHLSLISTTRGGGTFESPFLHGMGTA